MGVALSSLRVSAEFDASGYSRGAAEKVAADNSMIESDRRANAARAQADAAMAKSIPGMAAVSKSLLQGYGAGQQFEMQIRKIGNAVDQGMGLDRANLLLDGAYRKFGLTANAVALAEKGFVSIAPAVDVANRRFEAHNEVLARTAAQTQALTAAQRAQTLVNQVTGVRDFDTAGRGADIAAYGSQLDALRAKYVPLYAAGAAYKATLTDINQAAKVGAISETERADAVARTKAAFVDQVGALRGVKAATVEATAATGLQRYELINLSRQAQDVVVSLAGGQGIGTVLIQQGSQIGDVFASSKSTVGDFARQAMGWLGGFLTLGRVAFGGVAAAITGAGFALSDYLSKQDKVQLGLTGAGRASGASAASINATANAGASPFGLSVSEARELATAIAATGQVANDNLPRIVALGHDIATALGTDAKGAAELLAKSFADPAKGAADLNARLGFLDAGMQRQIQNLVAQNRLTEAQQILEKGLKSGLDGVNDAVSGSTKLWTALGNAISNAWDATGNFIARSLGIGKSLSDQYQGAVDKVKALQSSLASDQQYADILKQSGMSKQEVDQVIPSLKVMGEAIVKAQAEADGFKKKMDQAAESAQQVKANFDSLRISATIMGQLPEITQRQSAQNAAAVAGAFAEDPLAQQKLNVTQAEADRVRAILNQLKNDFKTTFESVQISSKIALDAVTAFSPAAKALIAQRQAVEQYRAAGGIDPNEKAKISQDAYTLSIKQSTNALEQAARQRLFTANQAVDAARLTLVKLNGKLTAKPPAAKPSNSNEKERAA